MVEKREDWEVLIAKFLRGEATPEEAIELMEWRSATEENEALFTSLELVFHEVNGTNPYKEEDVNQAWISVKGDFREKAPVIPLWKRREIYTGAAAIALIAFLIGTLWQSGPTEPGGISGHDTIDSLQAQTHLVATNDVAEFELIDGSVIQLEPGSVVDIEQDFNTKQRVMSLTGNGTFDVTHDETMPFTIKMGKLNVVDVGTVFNLRTSGDTIKVVVSEGEVQLRLNNEVLNVSEGDSAFYVISQDLIERYKQPTSRQDKVFEFQGTKLSEVVTILGEFFNRKIVVMDQAIADCELSVTFKNESLANILNIISELLDIKVIRNNEIIGLYGEGCL